MENQKEIIELTPILTVFISGIFGLMVSLVTWKLANQREKRKFKQDFLVRDLKDKEDLYVSVLASLDKTIRITESGAKFENIHNEFSLITSKINLLGTETINQKLGNVSETLYYWTSEYKKSLPKELGDTGMGFITNHDSKHRKKANELYPKLMTEMNELVAEIKKELNRLKLIIES